MPDNEHGGHPPSSTGRGDPDGGGRRSWRAVLAAARATADPCREIRSTTASPAGSPIRASDDRLGDEVGVVGLLDDPDQARDGPAGSALTEDLGGQQSSVRQRMPERADELLLEIACGIGQVGATAWAVCSLLLHLGEAVGTVPLNHGAQRPFTGWRRRAGGVGCAARPRRSHTTASQPRSDGRDLGNELGGASPAVAPARPAPRTPGHRRLGMLRATGRPAWDRHRRSAPSSARPDRCHGQRVATRRSWRTTTPPTVPAVETMRSPNSSSRRCERSHQPSKERRRRGLHPQVVWVDCRPAWCPAQRAPPQSAASKRGRGTIARR